MFTEDHLNKYGDILIWGLKTARKGRFKKGEIVFIQYDPPALRLAEVIYAKLMDMGINPVHRMTGTSRMEKTFYSKADKRQLLFIPPGEKELYENLNGRIFLRAPESLTHLKDIDPKRIGKVLVARKFLRDILDKREASGLYSWTLCTYPTEELASQAKTDMETYVSQIIKACHLDGEDPSSRWDEIYRNTTEIKKWLNSLKVKLFHIESENVDLKITPGEKRLWKGISGHNIPSFEVFMSPDWRGTSGKFYANLPSFRSGNYVEEVRLHFEKGVVKKIEAKEGEVFAAEQIKIDRGASRVGEFSLTDRRFSRIDRFMADTLFDENFGGPYGNCHIALGASYTDTYAGDPSSLTDRDKKMLGFNESALHWDLVNTEAKRVTAYLTSGKKTVIYENGIFMY
ncbi:MAG: aminopeptidase [Syntrophorhabdaceae bacterium]|nr:aminopeptidase [Syntrophorhabdaceae bacterium]